MNALQYDLLKFFNTYAGYISRTDSELVVDDHEMSFVANPSSARYFIFGEEILRLFDDVDEITYKQTEISSILEKYKKDFS